MSTLPRGHCTTHIAIESFESHNIAWLVACPCYDDRDSGDLRGVTGGDGCKVRVSVW